MTRLLLYTMAIGGALVLLCACAGQEQPTATPAGTRLSARTAVPTRVLVSASSPSPPPTVEPAGEPLRYAQTLSSPGPATADLAIQAIPAETGIYTLTVRNLGPDPATGIVLTDVLPSGVTPLWTEPAQPVCGRQGRDAGCDLGNLQAGDAATVTLDLSAGGSETLITGTQLAGVTVTLSVPTCAIDRESSPSQVTCRLSRLPPGAGAPVRVGIRIDDPAAGALVHTATVVAQQTDPNRSNNQVTSAIAAGAAEPAPIAAEGPIVATAVPTATDLIVQADGPTTVIAGQPFTYTYVISNRGTSAATGVWFEDAVPSDMNLVAYAPVLPPCEQHGDRFTCYLPDVDSGRTVTFTLSITGYGQQPMTVGLDPLMPGWPLCTVLKERTWLHIVQCELGELRPGQATRVELALVAIGVRERTSVNTASVRASEADLHPVDNTSTTTITIQVSGTPGGE